MTTAIVLIALRQREQNALDAAPASGPSRVRFLIWQGFVLILQVSAVGVLLLQLFCVMREQDLIARSSALFTDFVTGPAPNLYKLHSYYTAITVNYVKKVAGDDVITAIEDHVDDAESRIKTEVTDTGDDVIDAIEGHVNAAEDAIKLHVTNTCPAPSTRRLGANSRPDEKQQSFEDFIHSDQAQEAREYAKKHGLKEEDMDKIFSKIKDIPKDAGDSLNADLEDQIKTAFSDPVIGKLVDAKLGANAGAFTGKIVASLLESVTDEKTRRLDGMYRIAALAPLVSFFFSLSHPLF